MLARPISFKRILGAFLAQILSVEAAYSEMFDLTESDKKWLGDRIFDNECAGKFECLTSWNAGENFPSLGIGHFIWFPPGLDSPFEETFPQLVQYFTNQEVPLPAWLDSKTDAPWHSREYLYTNFYDEQTIQLRELLKNTKSEQLDFIIQRLNQSLEQIIMSFPSRRHSVIREKLSTISQSHSPYGSYAIIDYVHFKGTGLSRTERYQKHGWGLKQVIQEMGDSPTTIHSFVRSSKLVLNRRVEYSPESRNEQRWLPGWHRRVETYLPPQ
ncbi:MAG: hypothetical protein CMQ41_05680 [Gammaproteobacteria bacterium]|nr:hypothetical protein [Gammaproteobacteria bacterium]